MNMYSKSSCCKLCGTSLVIAFEAVGDAVYGIPGRWNLERCSNTDCEALFLAHDLSADQLRSFYEGYSTHSPPVLQAKGLKSIYRKALRQILHYKLGYPPVPGVTTALLARVFGLIPYFREEALSRVFWLPCLEGGSVIEVGFGNAQGLALLQEGGWTVRGSEMDEFCVSQARSLGFDVICGDFNDGLYDSETADAVVASHVIEHLPDPRAFIARTLDVLRPGGHLVLRTPNGRSKDAKRYGRYWRGLEVPRHLCIQTPKSLATMAKNAGFSDIRVVGTPLGGFCVQQSKEIAAGLRPSTRQNSKTWSHNLAQTFRALLDNGSSSEIVLFCTKPIGAERVDNGKTYPSSTAQAKCA